MKIKRKKTYIFILIFLIIAIIIFIPLLNPLEWSNESIRKRMFRLAPIGTSMEDLLIIIEKNDWKIKATFTRGYTLVHGIPGPPVPDYMLGENSISIGEKAIEVIVGNIIFGSVGVFYAFDGNDKLVDIAVIKYVRW